MTAAGPWCSCISGGHSCTVPAGRGADSHTQALGSRQRLPLPAALVGLLQLLCLLAVCNKQLQLLLVGCKLCMRQAQLLLHRPDLLLMLCLLLPPVLPVLLQLLLYLLLLLLLLLPLLPCLACAEASVLCQLQLPVFFCLLALHGWLAGLTCFLAELKDLQLLQEVLH